MEFRTKPFAHQLRIWDETKDRDYHGLFLEMGCGKSWIAINAAAWKSLNQGCNGMLVVAPNGVHQNWIFEEIPRHWPESIPWNGCAYYSTRSTTRKQKQAVEFVTNCGGFAVLSMSYDAVGTVAGFAAAEKFLKTRKNPMMVCDESARIKTPKIKRTTKTTTLGRKARFRWILTGTPVANGPFDVFSQIRFMDESFWKRLELAPYSVFKRRFGVFEPRRLGNGQKFDQLVEYQNLDQLNRLLAPISSRVTKDECLDLPPKIYQKMYFDLSPATREQYDTLRDNYIVELAGGSEISAPLAIVRLTRLQQLTCGFMAVDGEDTVQDLVDSKGRSDNPRLDLLSEICEDLDSAIIWARYKKDIDNICAMLGEGKCVKLDGRTPDHYRKALIDRFQEGEVPFFVANPAAIGEGITLHRTGTVIYYSNSFRLDQRLQSEDRAHRIGQTRNVTIIDLVARGTVDEKIVENLRNKQNVAALVTGDTIKEWL